MKSVNVSELKANLSRYLRLASAGQRLIVKDRDEPIAQIGPLQPEAVSWRDRLARQGRLRLGSQAWASMAIARIDRTIDIQGSLQAVREEPSEVRRR